MPNLLEDLVAAMTVSELAERSGRSVTDLAVFALGGAGRPKKPAAAARVAGKPTTNGTPARQPARARSGEVNTRSAAGREAYEAAVLATVRDAPGEVAANDIRAQVGGTSMQARAALNRLIENGEVRFKGKARGTRYFI